VTIFVRQLRSSRQFLMVRMVPPGKLLTWTIFYDHHIFSAGNVHEYVTWQEMTDMAR